MVKHPRRLSARQGPPRLELSDEKSARQIGSFPQVAVKIKRIISPSRGLNKKYLVTSKVQNFFDETFSLARPFQPNRRPSEGASRRVGDSSTLGVKVWLKFWQKQLKNSRACLAGGFNPFEKYARHIRTNHWWIQYLFQHSYVPR